VSFKTPVSVLVVIHTPGLAVLLLERAASPGFWQSVTGSLEACSAAELRDWRLSNRFEIFPQWRARYAADVTHNTEHVFSLCIDEQPIRLAPDEHRGWRWLPWREAAAACFSWTNRDAILMLGASAAPAAPLRGNSDKGSPE